MTSQQSSSARKKESNANPSLNPFLRGVAATSTFAGWCSAAMILMAVLVTCQMIFVRFVLNASTVWQTELVVYLVIAATLIGLPYVQQLRGHVNVDLVPLSLKGRARFGLSLFTSALSILVVSIMLYYGYDYWHLAWSKNWTSDTVWAVRLWIPYIILPLGFGLLLLQLIADFIAVVIGSDSPFGLEDN